MWNSRHHQARPAITAAPLYASHAQEVVRVDGVVPSRRTRNVERPSLRVAIASVGLDLPGAVTLRHASPGGWTPFRVVLGAARRRTCGSAAISEFVAGASLAAWRPFGAIV